jgi:hypothetical protein
MKVGISRDSILTALISSASYTTIVVLIWFFLQAEGFPLPYFIATVFFLYFAVLVLSEVIAMKIVKRMPRRM